MAKSQQQVDIAITARDEASSVFKNVGAAAREFNMEARRGGDQALERLIKGGGALGLATFAMEAAGKAAQGLRESMKGVADGTMGIDQAIGHTVEMTADAIPVLGQMVKGWSSITAATEDSISAVAGWFGASKETIEYLKSDKTLKEEAEAFSKAQDAASAEMMNARKRVSLAGLEGIAREKEAARQAYEEEKKRSQEKEHKEEAALPPDQRRVIDKIFNQTRLLEKQEYDAKVAEIDKKEQQERVVDQQSHESRMREIQQQAREADLEAQGKHLEAKLAGLERANEKALAAIDKRAEEERKKRPDDIPKINANAEEERLAQSNAFEAEQRRTREEDAKRVRKEQDELAKKQDEESKRAQREQNESADKHAQLERDLASNRIAAMKEEASLGNAAAGEQARKLELEMKYQEQKEKLLKLLRDEKDLTAADVANINKSIADAAKSRDEQLQHPKIEIVEDRKANLEESSRLQGIKDNAENPLVRIAQEQLSEHKKMNDALATIITNTTPTPQDEPKSLFGF